MLLLVLNNKLKLQEDCSNTFGRVFDHQLHASDEMKAKRDSTEILWNNFYSNEPFNLPQSKEEILKLYEKSVTSSFKYDIGSFDKTNFHNDCS